MSTSPNFQLIFSKANFILEAVHELDNSSVEHLY